VTGFWLAIGNDIRFHADHALGARPSGGRTINIITVEDCPADACPGFLRDMRGRTGYRREMTDAFLALSACSAFVLRLAHSLEACILE
jgi:hypothetical protein